MQMFLKYETVVSLSTSNRTNPCLKFCITWRMIKERVDITEKVLWGRFMMYVLPALCLSQQKVLFLVAPSWFNVLSAVVVRS